MYELKFHGGVCETCETADCLARCQYMELGAGEAHEEMMKVVRGEDSRVLRECGTCYGCEEYCKKGNHPFYLISERREEKGILTAPRPITNQWINMCEPQGKFAVGVVGETALSCCFIGELRALGQGPLFEDVARSFVTGAEFMCPAVYLHYAKPSVIKERLPRVLDNFHKLGVKEVLCLHDECYGTYTSIAPAYGMEVPFTPIHYMDHVYRELLERKGEIQPLGIKAAFTAEYPKLGGVYEVRHFTQVLDGLVRGGRLRLSGCGARVTYHDPCYLGRHNRLYDPPRDVLRAIPGLELVEMRRNKADAFCCGGGGGNFFTDMIGLGEEAPGKVRVREAAETGAEVLAVSCPACAKMLGDAVKSEGLEGRLRVADVAEIVTGALSH